MPPSPVEIVLVGRERPHARVAAGARPPPVPRGAVRVRAVLDQEDPFGRQQLGDLLDLERDVAADVDEERGPRPVACDLRLEVGERHAEVVAVAVDELDAGARTAAPRAASP